MMKYFLPLILVTLLLACNSAETTEVEKALPNNFSISGTIADAENTAITLEAMSQTGTITVASAKTDMNGKFELQGNIPGMGIYQLRLGEAQDMAIPLTLEPKNNLKINSSFSTFASKPNVSGTDWAPTMNQYMLLFNDFLVKQQSLSAEAANMTQEAMTKKMLVLRKELDAFSIAAMKSKPGSPFNIILFSSASPVNGFETWDPTNMDLLKLVSQAFQEKYSNSPIASTMETQVMQIESAYNEYLNSKGGMKLAPEIDLKNPRGKAIKLSSLRGKYVLVDFWASWCGPCRQENPNVVRLYNKYKNKGFTIYSVSLDKDPVAWEAAIKQDGLIWPNHVSDLLQWQSPMISLYGFNGIPYTVLLDKKGEIIGTGLRGPSLEQKLVELLGN
ncbi:MAG: TlpA disulfide reductase family protein [Bacteroidota bacterium]